MINSPDLSEFVEKEQKCWKCQRGSLSSVARMNSKRVCYLYEIDFGIAFLHFCTSIYNIGIKWKSWFLQIADQLILFYADLNFHVKFFADDISKVTTFLVFQASPNFIIKKICTLGCIWSFRYLFGRYIWVFFDYTIKVSIR